MSEISGWAEGLNLELSKAQGFYGVIALGIVAGLVLNFVGFNPVKALIVAAVVNGVAAPPLIAVLAVISRSRSIMG